MRLGAPTLTPGAGIPGAGLTTRQHDTDGTTTARGRGASRASAGFRRNDEETRRQQVVQLGRSGRWTGTSRNLEDIDDANRAHHMSGPVTRIRRDARGRRIGVAPDGRREPRANGDYPKRLPREGWDAAHGSAPHPHKGSPASAGQPCRN